ncbi:major capsid protein [Marinomonas ostreistagni]|uniref:Major capsid protein n=1 Tax=Marinomonas ostreistagni TaxID=359209 RepID=A0ABS0ZC12_9GAMM|nr:major capsid protein [Marinomonas ostreistagni]MBJ7550748.1 major capsid protein [Marinomonas ostreistagni]
MYTSRELIAAKKVFQPHTTFFRRVLFARERYSDKSQVAIDKMTSNKRKAVFVSPKVAGKVRHQDGMSTRLVTPPYIKEKTEIDPEDYAERIFGEDLGTPLTPEQRYNATVMIINEDQHKAIDRAEEKMCADLIVTGKCEVAESELHGAFELDYGRDEANTIKLIGAARWSQLPADYDIMSELEEYIELSSGLPDTFFMGKTAFANLRRFDQVKDLMDKTKSNGEASITFSPQQKKDEGVQYKGFLGEYEIYVYNGKYEDEDGNEQLYFPAEGLAIGPYNYDGLFAYGAIKDIKAMKNGMVKSKRYPKIIEEDDPSMEYMTQQSSPLPIMPDANEWVYIEVDGPV